MPSSHQKSSEALPILEVLVTDSALLLAGRGAFWGNRGETQRLTPGGRVSRPTLGCRKSHVSLMRFNLGRRRGTPRLPVGLGAGPPPWAGPRGSGRRLGAAPSGEQCSIAWPLCSPACHGARRALPGSVIEIHCQIY